MIRPIIDNRRPTTLFKSVFVLLFVVSCWSFVSIAYAQSVDLLWQGNTYTPPFYKGRTLWSNQSRITLVAIPQGLGSSANLTYKWTRNGTVLGSIGGVGRNSLSFTDSILSRPQTIKVEILSGQNVLASTVANIAPITPVLAVYENNPLYGFMFHRETTGTHELEEREATFSAFPLFFSIVDRTDNTLEYEWRTNVGDAETTNSVTYRTPENMAGSSKVDARVSNKENIMQSASRNFLILFDNL